ncbi:MAG: type II toxin-antitoxin system RelE/ParE family toxin [Nanoarchaeota archaeon]|nr:type II toxin-antitoxin system RelE/ParE family toxin [Nanoarchaeota archaeon]
MYHVELSKNAERQFSKLNDDLQDRIICALDRIKVRPYSFVKRLIASPYYRLRVGDYRLILDINDGKLVIFVIEVGHRKNIYK